MAWRELWEVLQDSRLDYCPHAGGLVLDLTFSLSIWLFGNAFRKTADNPTVCMGKPVSALSESSEQTCIPLSILCVTLALKTMKINFKLSIKKQRDL